MKERLQAVWPHYCLFRSSGYFHHQIVHTGSGSEALPWSEIDQNMSYVRREVIMTVTLGNSVFWDIKTKFVPRRKITSSLQSPAG
jgi:hypothetical protein